jgi:hypothetical protein
MIRKGVGMKGKAVYTAMACALLFAVLMFPAGGESAEKASSLVGQPVTNFRLSSSQDRLAGYGQDYYGRYNLIVTFFPAAFTPV